MAGQRFYDDAEAEEILRRAVSSTSPTGSMSHEGLLRAAAELGISPEEVEQAEAQVRLEREEVALRKEYRQHLVNEFISSLGGYVVTNAFLIWIFHFPNWIWWVIGGWGISLVKDLFELFAPSAEKERKFQRWKAKRLGYSSFSPSTKGVGEILDEHFASSGRPDEKIQAIKVVRTQTGLGLKEAKDAVDDYYLHQGW